jgi:hypothetical protein
LHLRFMCEGEWHRKSILQALLCALRAAMSHMLGRPFSDRRVPRARLPYDANAGTDAPFLTAKAKPTSGQNQPQDKSVASFSIVFALLQRLRRTAWRISAETVLGLSCVEFSNCGGSRLPPSPCRKKNSSQTFSAILFPPGVTGRSQQLAVSPPKAKKQLRKSSDQKPRLPTDRVGMRMLHRCELVSRRKQTCVLGRKERRGLPVY